MSCSAASRRTWLTSRNTKLLSFGEAEEIPEEDIIVKKKGIVRRDCESASGMEQA